MSGYFNSLAFPYTISGVVTLTAAVLYGRYLLKNRREQARDTSTTPLPPTWPEMWDRMDKLEKRISVRDVAFGNILTVIAAAWPKGAPRPVFDQADLDALSDTIPAEWLHPSKEQ